jgi:hypothetical protein
MATPGQPRSARADDFLLPLPKSLPLVEPGRYVGVSKKVEKRSYFGAREYLSISFDLFADVEAIQNGQAPIARGVKGYFNIGGPHSRYARLLGLVFGDAIPDRPRGGALLDKALEVEVETVSSDQKQRPLPASLRYSKVSEVICRA